MDFEAFRQLSLRGGFLLLRISMTAEPMVDAMGRLAVAKTEIIGQTLEITLGSSNPDPVEISISLYHEVLEAAAVAARNPPPSVCELNKRALRLPPGVAMPGLGWRARAHST